MVLSPFSVMFEEAMSIEVDPTGRPERRHARSKGSKIWMGFELPSHVHCATNAGKRGTRYELCCQYGVGSFQTFATFRVPSDQKASLRDRGGFFLFLRCNQQLLEDMRRKFPNANSSRPLFQCSMCTEIFKSVRLIPYAVDFAGSLGIRRSPSCHFNKFRKTTFRVSRYLIIPLNKTGDRVHRVGEKKEIGNK